MKSHLFSCHRDKILICQLLAIDLKRNAVNRAETETIFANRLHYQG